MDNETSSNTPPHCDWQGCAKGIIDKVRRVVVDPVGCWPEIRAEKQSIPEMYRTFVAPLWAVWPVATFVGLQIFFPFSFFGGIFNALASYLFSLASVFLMAVVLEEVARILGGAAERGNTFKLVAYSLAPGQLAGVLGIVPPLIPLAALVFFYGIYLFVKGLPQMVDVPEGKQGELLWVSLAALLGTGVILMLILQTLHSCSAG